MRTYFRYFIPRSKFQKYCMFFKEKHTTFQKKILWKLDDVRVVRHDKFEMSFQPSLPTLEIVSSQLWILKQRRIYTKQRCR